MTDSLTVLSTVMELLGLMFMLNEWSDGKVQYIAPACLSRRYKHRIS